MSFVDARIPLTFLSVSNSSEKSCKARKPLGARLSQGVAQFHSPITLPPRVALVILMHKRKTSKIQARKIQRIIFRGSFCDKKMGEIVSLMTRSDVIEQLNEPVEIHLIPDIEKGEVLVDSRGRGSLPRFL